jgi:hypothetical protein
VSDADSGSIREVVEQYFYAIDSRRIELLADCFTCPAEISMLGSPRRITVPDDVHMVFGGVKRYFATSHFITSHHSTVDGRRAASHTLAIAVVVPTPESLVSVRGLEYRDILERGAAGWRIAERVHTAVWQFDTAQSPVAVPPQVQLWRTQQGPQVACRFRTTESSGMPPSEIQKNTTWMGRPARYVRITAAFSAGVPWLKLPGRTARRSCATPQSRWAAGGLVRARSGSGATARKIVAVAAQPDSAFPASSPPRPSAPGAGCPLLVSACPLAVPPASLPPSPADIK